MGSAMTSAISVAYRASSAVSGSRCASSWATGRRVHSDSPRSPRTARPSQPTYCTCSGRSSPSLARSSSMSLAYDVSASMSCTASPGISRGSVKTMNEAMSNDGTATTRRRARYRLSTSAIEPGRHEASPVVVAEARRVVLQRVLPDADVLARRHLDVVLLAGQVPLDVENDLPGLGEVGGPSLALEHVGHHRIVDVALVLLLARV